MWISLILMATSVLADEGLADGQWGTYRPNLYFGLRTRTESMLKSFGIMWMGLDHHYAWQDLRHDCRMEDGLVYNFLKHDGRAFAVQHIEDPKLNLHLEFTWEYLGANLTKASGGNGGDWVLKMEAQKLHPNVMTQPWMLMQYWSAVDQVNPAAFSPDLKAVENSGVLTVEQEDKFSSYMFPSTPDATLKQKHIILEANSELSWRIKDAVQNVFAQTLQKAMQELDNDPEKLPVPIELFDLPNLDGREYGNVVLNQLTVNPDEPAVIDIVFLDHSLHPDLDTASKRAKYAKDLILKQKVISEKSSAFDDRFERVFQLKKLGFSEDKQEFGRKAMSNLIGGIAYFYGDSIVNKIEEDVEPDTPSNIKNTAEDDELEALLGDSKSDKPKVVNDEEEDAEPKGSPQKVAPAELFTATPSRPFFPRGFLWDEGFHQLVILRWDVSLTLDITNSWLRLMTEDGWIAREQILGEEARSKVPEKFQVQYTHYANPPTLILPIVSLLHSMTGSGKKFIMGQEKMADMIVMADAELMDEWNRDSAEQVKKLLTEAYPLFKKNFEWYRRTQRGRLYKNGVVSSKEEVYRWRGRTHTHCLTSGLDDYPRAANVSKYELHLDLTSWMGMYADMLRAIAEYLGAEKDVKYFTGIHEQVKQNINELFWSPEHEAYGDLIPADPWNAKSEMKHVVHRGYISLFPFFFNLVPADSDQLGHVLDMLHNPQELWTAWGIRSLSVNDRFFGMGENYWRGPIWINVNYLVLRALYLYYIPTKGPHQAKAKEIYDELRHNLIENIYEQHKKTGHLWEQYSPMDGTGSRSHPFTGWTSLVLNVMSETY